MNFMCSRVLLNLYQLIFNTLKRNKNRLQNQKRNENTTTYILHMNNYFTIYYYHQLFLFQKGKIPSETFLYAYQNKQRRRGKSKALVFIVKNKVEKRKKRFLKSNHKPRNQINPINPERDTYLWDGGRTYEK